MTGNNKVWRASLAGLASVAMLATMGVVAGTANAAFQDKDGKDVTVSVKLGNDTAPVEYGDSLADYAARNAFAPASTKHTTLAPAAKAGQKFVGFEGDVSLTAPVTADTTLKPVYAEDNKPDRAVPVTVTYNGKFSYFDETKGLVDAANNSKTSYTFHAESNKTLSDLFKPVDAADGYLATTWNFTGVTADGKKVDLGTHANFSEVNAQNFASITAEPADETNNVRTVIFDYTDGNVAPADKVKLTGAFGDGFGLGSVNGVANTDLVLAVDAVKDSEVTAPTFVVNPKTDAFSVPGSWKNDKDDKLVVNAGDKVTVSDDNAKNVYKADNATEFVVVKYEDGLGKVIETETVKLDKTDENGTKYGFADGTENLPTRDGYVFDGWDAVSSNGSQTWNTEVSTTDPTHGLDNYAIYKGFTYTFVAQWEQTSDISVTFRDAVYKGSHDDVTVKVPTGKVWDGSDAPSWNDRPGYAFSGWATADGTPYTFNKLIDSDQASFVLYAQYAQVTDDAVEAALKYVTDGKATIGRGNETGTDNSELFTDASFKEFKTVWTKVNNEYKEAQFAAQNNKISKETSTDLVKQLAAAWQKLAFVGDDNVRETSYRFYNPITNEHLFTTNLVEVSILKSNPDWNYEPDGNLQVLKSTNEKLFKALAAFGDDTVSKDVKDQINSVADPLVVQVQRLYNRITNEHLFTTNQAEVDKLSAGDWTLEPDNAFFAPSPFSSSQKSVYRLYNPILNQHLFTANPAEVEKTTQEDWVLEGVEFKAL